ncbi:hypothetical protein ACM66B_006627 [Microbotryomycetes sp. NB124-2]
MQAVTGNRSAVAVCRSALARPALRQQHQQLAPCCHALPITSARTVTTNSQATQDEAAPVASTSASSSSSSHFVVTLTRSPLHLPKSIKATCQVLGLHKRLSTTIVPNTSHNVGALLKVKELVHVQPFDAQDADHVSLTRQWRERQGDGRRGSGIRAKGGELSVIRVGSERARGDERGFKVVSRA